MLSKITSLIIGAVKLIGKGIVKAYKIAAIPASVAGKIAIKAGASAKTASTVTAIAKLGTAIAVDQLVGEVTDKIPQPVGPVVRDLNRAAIIKFII